MKYYFTLQFKRILRKLEAAGIHPLPGLVLTVVVFLLLSYYMFRSTVYASWIYSLFALSAVINLGERMRNEHLKRIFNGRKYWQIRMTENILVVIPFVLYLFYEFQITTGIALIAAGMLLTVFNAFRKPGVTLPTPFKRFPFEFVTGFRSYYWLFAGAYFITFKSLQTGNFNLGLASLGLSFFTGMLCYAKPEPSYFVWIFSTDSRGFLRKKMVTGIRCITLVNLPVLLILSIAYPDKLLLIAGFQLLGYLYLIAMILAKYSAYPNEINIPQALFIAICIWFPPMLLVVIPMFYARSKRKVKPILE